MGWMSIQKVLPTLLFGFLFIEGSYDVIDNVAYQPPSFNPTTEQVVEITIQLPEEQSGSLKSTITSTNQTSDIGLSTKTEQKGSTTYTIDISDCPNCDYHHRPCHDTTDSLDCDPGYVCIKEAESGSGTCYKQEITEDECWKCNGFNQVCPQDSKLIKLPYPQCCNSSSVRCLCNDCPPVHCGANQSVMIVSVGNGQPGSCCDTYKCLEGPNMCTYDKTVYKDNEIWAPDKCSLCRCEKGLVYCSRQTCEPSAGCGFMFTPKNECCPVCAGCMSDSRLFMLNQSWLEDEGCFKCSCKEGRARCTAEYCLAPPCDNPRKIENVCCPVCDEPNTAVDILKPTKCSVIEESLAITCNLSCEFGFARDKDGCLKCSCAGPPCEPNQCLYGFAAEESTRRSCECRPPGCDQILCSKQCAYGFENDPTRACPICKCRACPQVQNCSMTCIYGFKLGTDGCPICDCMKANEINRVPTFKHCEIGGNQYDHMEIFFDGCRKCICLNGTQLCSLISCPPVNCPSMSIKPGSCCPSCSEADIQRSRLLKPAEGLDNLCVGTSGLPLPDGESLTIDKCTTCKCFVGKAFCSVADCTDALKNCSLMGTIASPFRVEGSCCPTCSPGPTDIVKRVEISNNRGPTFLSCHDGELVYADGDYWMSNDCTSCLCRAGITYCYPHQCPVLTCSVAVLKKGTCCPFCLERALMTVCIFNEKVYRNGDIWNVNDCSSCTCRRGQIVCTRTVCSPIKCNFPVSVPGHCCPVCLDSIKHDSPNVLDSQQLNTVSSHPGNMLYASLLGAIILLVVVVVALLIVIIWRANLCYTRSNQFYGHHRGDLGGEREHERLFRRKTGKCNKRTFQQDSSVLSSLCASIQFDTTDNSAGVLIYGNNDFQGFSTGGGSARAHCSSCSYNSGGRLLENHGRLVKYELIGGGAGKHGGATVGISEHSPVDYRATTTVANANSSSLLLLSSSNRSDCCEPCSCCGYAQLPQQQQRIGDCPISQNNGSGTLSDLFWDQNNVGIQNVNNDTMNPEGTYNEIEERSLQQPEGAPQETSVIYV